PTTSNSWILIQTLTPEEVIASNQTNQHEPSSSTHIPPASVEVSFSQDTKLPIESLLPEAAYVYNTVQEEPAQNVLLLPDALSVHSQVTSSARPPGPTNPDSLEAKTTESSLASTGSYTKQSTIVPPSASTTVRHSSIASSTTDSTTTVTGQPGPVSPIVTQLPITNSPQYKPSSQAVEINESLETTTTSPTSTTIAAASVASTHFTSSAAPTLTTSDMLAAVSEQTSSASSEESGTSSSTTDAWSSSKRPVDLTSTTTEAMLVRETTTAVDESIESATEGSGEEETGSGSEEGSSEEEEEEEEEGTDESEETTDATTASIENVTDSLHKVTNESSTLTSASPVSTGSSTPKHDSVLDLCNIAGTQHYGNQTALLTTTTLSMLANVTTDGVTLAPDFLTTSTLPTLEGIDYRTGE
uniref:Uncharacterized protein n=1 Tax=Anopheles culicifacies TaxID=139723 RepID=A0A182MBK0_9DIPT